MTNKADDIRMIIAFQEQLVSRFAPDGFSRYHDHQKKMLAALTALSEDNAAMKAEIERLRHAHLYEIYLSHFPYEDWDDGEDSVMRINDWVILSWQDHNGNDHDDGYGKIVTHHNTDIPVILMIEGFEEDGEPHGTYAPICFHPWNTISRIKEETARQALKDTK